MEPPQTTQDEIVVAAMKVFERLGFARTRVEDILATAKVSRRTYYSYFTSKEDVLAGIYARTTKALLTAMMAAVQANTAAPLQAILLGTDLFLNFHLESPRMLQVLLEQAMLSDSPLAALRKGFRAQLYELLSQAAGKPDPYIPIALVAALEGVSHHLLENQAGPKDIERAKQSMRLIVQKVIGAPKDPVHPDRSRALGIRRAR